MPKRFMSRHSNETFLSHSSEKLRREQLLCFTKCPETKSFLDSRGEGMEVVYRLTVESFCLTVPRNLVEEHSVLHKNSSIEKFYG